jgi:purine nucleoside phosphorylase
MTTSNHAIECDHAASSVAAAVLGCLKNLATGLSQEKLSYDEVLEVGKKAAADFARLLQKPLGG